MSWDKILGQEKAIGMLKEQMCNKRISHAYLFIGPEGVGKKLTAEVFAKALNCLAPDGKPCNTCKHCKQISSGNSIAVSSYAPEGKKFKIEEIRSICKYINLKIEKDAAQVIIIDGADKMTQEAANNMLKTIEEPPANTYFILLAEEKAAILPTIISRCQVVLFTPIAASKVAHYLQDKISLEYDKALTFAKIAQGSIANAEKFANDEHYLQLRNVAEEIFLFEARDAFDVLELSARIEGNKEHLLEILELVRLFTRDAVVYQTGAEELIINSDKGKIFSQKALAVPEGIRQYKLIDEAIKNLKHNANRKLTIDTLLLALKLDRRKSA